MPSREGRGPERSRRCRTVQDLLPLYVSEELSERRNREVGLHLEACASCRAEFEAYCGVRFELQSYRDETVDDVLVDFVDAVEDRVHTEEPDLQHERATGQWRTRKRRAPILGRLGLDGTGVNVGRLAAYGGAMAAALAIAVWFATPGTPDPMTPGAAIEARAKRVVAPAVASGKLLSPQAPVPFRNPGVPSAAFANDLVQPVSADSLQILAGPGVSIKVAVPERAMRWPVAPVPKVQPYPYRGRSPFSSGKFVTH